MTDIKILESLVEKCVRCDGGDCYNCGQKPINIEEALTELRAYYREKIKKVLPKKKGAVPEHIVHRKFIEKNNVDLSNYITAGFNQAIDAILKEIDKEI